MLRVPRPCRGYQGLMSSNHPTQPTILKLLWLLLVSYGVRNSHCSTIPDNSTDILSLLEFKEAINDLGGALRSWNRSRSHCQWRGVDCSLKHPGRVTALSLGDLGLAGIISPSIGNLTFLEKLNLSINSFSGELPPLNRLHKLQELVLTQNSLQGTIPDTFANHSKLNYLDLSGNFLTGQIPLNINLLCNLSYLSLSMNNLTGMIPPSLKNISHLSVLYLANNNFIGSIPDETGQLPNLQYLFIGGNNLSGGIPGTLLNRSSLQRLDLSINMLGGTLPSNFGDMLPNLQILFLGYNNFEGTIPASLGNISGLVALDLSFNYFSGHVPSSLGKNGLMLSLNLQTNKLEANDSQSWEFIHTLSNFSSSLLELILGQNLFQGVIPNSIGRMTSLQKLGLGINYFTGAVPNSLGNLTELMILELRNNNLNGSIDRWVGKLKNLGGLILYGNKFSGSIPTSVGNLTKLSLILLQENEFGGPIPSRLGNLPVVLRLNLSCNNLSGSIPKEIFHPESTLINCVLSHNNLDGSLPSEIGNLRQLTELHLSSNKLTGEIPSTLGNCEKLQILELDHNFLRGNIIMSLSGLQSMTTLNLSNNNLSGVIPAKLGDLQYLTQLDLSYNNLQDEVPTNGVFGNVTAISLLGNRGLCGGVPDLHLPPCRTVSRRNEIPYYLIRVLIPIFGFMSLMLLVYFVITEKKMSRSKFLPVPFLDGKHIKVSYGDLAQATQNFSQSNLIGRGSYGSVYRGKLLKGKLEVAVKVLDLDMHGAEKSFLSECEALRSVQHRNLVPIITACSTVTSEGSLFKALVYEFMPNGNLDRSLHHKPDEKAPQRLGLTQRISIILNIADALDYIHNDSGSRSIIHCDVKPSNILLDDDMNAHLGDFGIASFYSGCSLAPTGHPNTNSFGVKGTIGYIAPEYAGGGRASTYGDVYSFGIVLLEMLTGKRPTDPMFENGLNVVNFVERAFPDQVLQVIDDTLQEECGPITQSGIVTEVEVYRCLCSLFEMGLSCTREYPSERINMKQAATWVRAIQASYVTGKPKPKNVSSR